MSARETSVSDNFGNLTSEFQKNSSSKFGTPISSFPGTEPGGPALLQKAALSELVDLHTVVRHMGQVQTLEPECSQVNQSLKIVIIKLAVVFFFLNLEIY